MNPYIKTCVLLTSMYLLGCNHTNKVSYDNMLMNKRFVLLGYRNLEKDSFYLPPIRDSILYTFHKDTLVIKVKSDSISAGYELSLDNTRFNYLSLDFSSTGSRHHKLFGAKYPFVRRVFSLGKYKKIELKNDTLLLYSSSTFQEIENEKQVVKNINKTFVTILQLCP